MILKADSVAPASFQLMEMQSPEAALPWVYCGHKDDPQFGFSLHRIDKPEERVMFTAEKVDIRSSYSAHEMRYFDSMKQFRQVSRNSPVSTKTVQVHNDPGVMNKIRYALKHADRVDAWNLQANNSRFMIHCTYEVCEADDNEDVVDWNFHFYAYEITCVRVV